MTGAPDVAECDQPEPTGPVRYDLDAPPVVADAADLDGYTGPPDYDG